MTSQSFLTNKKIEFITIYKIVGGILFFSVLMTLLFQINTSGICHSKTSFILFYSVAFWGVFGYGLFNWTKKENLNSGKIILIGLTTLFINQLFIRFGVEWSMQIFFGCGDFSLNWITYLITNNLMTNTLCFAAFTVTADLIKRNDVIEKAKYPNSNLDGNIEFKTFHKKKYPEEIAIKNGSELVRIKALEIRYVEVEQNCITLFTETGRFVLYQSLRLFAKNLNPDHFVRTHRSFLVNIFCIDKVKNLPSGDATIDMKTGERIKVSRTFKPDLLSKFNAS